jgi:hypothetical protein
MYRSARRLAARYDRRWRQRIIACARRALMSAANDQRLWDATTMLLATYPESLSAIASVMTKRQGSRSYRVHFHLFCRLAVEGDGLPVPFRRELELLLESYLRDIDRPTGSAAWMAGNCLGDHWDEDRAFPILKRVLIEGRCSCGRSAAALGLGCLAERTKSRVRRRQVQAVLADRATNDKSASVRAAAQLSSDKITSAPGQRRGKSVHGQVGDGVSDSVPS